MNGGRSPQADALVWGANLNPYERAYIDAWESYYGKLVPHGYVVHHMLGDGPHGIDPLFLVAMERGQHTALHNRARPAKTFPMPHGWVVVGGVLVLESEVDHREQIVVRNGADHREESDQRVVGRVAGAARKTGKLARAGKITLPAMSLLPLPDDARARARGIYPIVGEIFAARWAVYPGAPIPLTRAFVSQWPGANVSEKTASRGIDDLVAMGILALAGEEPSRCGRPMLLYLPAPVVVAEATPVASPLPMSEVIRASLGVYANELEDTSDQHAYWRLKDARYVFEPYVPGLFACRTMSGCAAMIREALNTDMAMTAPVTEVVPVDVVPCPVATAACALEVLQGQLETDLANLGAHPTHAQQVAFYRRFCEATRLRHFISAHSPDGGRAFVASPLNLWFGRLNWVVSPEALQEVDREGASDKAALPRRFSTTASTAVYAR